MRKKERAISAKALKAQMDLEKESAKTFLKYLETLKEDNMRIVSWNCHYGFTSEKAKAISEYDADILVLQECTKADYDAQKAEWKYRNWYWDDLNNENSSLGVAIFSNEYKIEFTVNFDRNWRYVVPYHITGKDTDFVLMAVWTKSGYTNYHEPIYSVLNSHQGTFETPVLLIGDFNTGRTVNDESWYNDLVTKLAAKGLKDCGNKKAPTYFRYFDLDRPYQNDYCFASEGFGRIVSFEIGDPKEWIKPELSDHCPIIVDFEFDDTDKVISTEEEAHKAAHEDFERAAFLRKRN
ncbi:endonuclease/exonuclease/phosphatase family protein [Treponema primitia]|uniref:endonuclease/exonuclease/phosphatase family protein n=1 Tax=Treponema primitia TaxID=88058 RepID=UPI0039813005